MSGHTPGPWETCVYSRQRMIRRVGSGAAFVHVLSTPPMCKPDEARAVANANARLIASAPELLEALRAAEQFIANGVELGFIRLPDADTPDPAHGTLPAIRAAISKATGEQS